MLIIQLSRRRTTTASICLIPTTQTRAIETFPNAAQLATDGQRDRGPTRARQKHTYNTQHRSRLPVSADALCWVCDSWRANWKRRLVDVFFLIQCMWWKMRYFWYHPIIETQPTISYSEWTLFQWWNKDILVIFENIQRCSNVGAPTCSSIIIGVCSHSGLLTVHVCTCVTHSCVTYIIWFACRAIIGKYDRGSTHIAYCVCKNEQQMLTTSGFRVPSAGRRLPKSSPTVSHRNARPTNHPPTHAHEAQRDYVWLVESYDDDDDDGDMAISLQAICVLHVVCLEFCLP